MPSNVIRFDRRRRDPHEVLEIVPFIDEISLTELVGQFETGAGMQPAGDAYGGLVPEFYRFGPMEDHFRGRPANAMGPKTPVLGCECGEWGCWPLMARITVTAGLVIWDSFEQPYRKTRDYTALGPFQFDHRQYDAALLSLVAVRHLPCHDRCRSSATPLLNCGQRRPQRLRSGICPALGGPMVLRRLGLVAAQMAPRPGARQALARVITASDLPGDGWSILDERTWRTGISGPATEWGRRARAARSVTAWRSFKAAKGKRGCWVQVVPLASEEDALSSLDGVWDRSLRNLRARVTVVREQDVDVRAFPGAGDVRAREQHTAGRAHGPDGAGVALMLAAACGTCVIIVGGSGAPEWTWDEMVSVAARQAA